jgi:hypothetical protein
MKESLKFIARIILIGIAALGLLMVFSCAPEPCEDCYTYTYSDGSTEWMCVEYDCSDY